jgi:hypothetical protein
VENSRSMVISDWGDATSRSCAWQRFSLNIWYHAVVTKGRAMPAISECRVMPPRGAPSRRDSRNTLAGICSLRRRHLRSQTSRIGSRPSYRSMSTFINWIRVCAQPIRRGCCFR